ncbi:2OG-Fe(II) oxygenase family oxidoreductase [Coniochaeta ligniaria NRRL 30616]|uniref:2OG-Fe(II) oxygenase family oxidoreductase n=1 Tax=Coniochaeta ligniaria NRRL 30616 TaxID=1408157 RepID=A0A1J7J1B8_9PEZI|nr:2OG-Fe(II) oxygenase family oxidoreductase [Coniochaeta ligniaria NRRL 30616]
MFSYVVGLVAVLVLFHDPISQLLSSSPGAVPQLQRTPRPRLNTELLALEDDGTANETGITCPPDAYSVHIFSREPLVLYIEGFLSPEERAHLLDISDPIFTPSTVTHDAGSSTHRDLTVRDSEVALIPRTETVRCVEARARSLQGWREEVWIERLRVQRYRPGGHYSHHFDWSSGRGGWGRVGSFMAWVDDDDAGLVGGGTEFPLLRRRGDARWCRFVECPSADDEETAGTVFKPIVGNAVYWENFRSDGSGRGYEETWHAGLPVLEGVKVGLNIWSWGRIE